MTLQEQFNAAAIGLLTQGCRSQNTDGICFYRHQGLKCAFGFLIPDPLYRPSMEDQSVEDILYTGKYPKMHTLGLDMELCQRLQVIHDWVDPSEWQWTLENLAKESGLIMPKI